MIKPQSGDIWRFFSSRREETYLIYNVYDTHYAGTYRVDALYLEEGFFVKLSAWNIEDGWRQLA